MKAFPSTIQVEGFFMCKSIATPIPLFSCNEKGGGTASAVGGTTVFTILPCYAIMNMYKIILR